MYSCVRVITPSGGTAPFTETISGINDARTGTAFVVRTIILLGGNTAAVNTLTYWGMTSTNSAGDSSYHYDWGVMHDTIGGAAGQGICHDFGIKVGSGADGYGYTFMDTWPDIFFGGYIAGYGYVNNVQAGSFDITWLRRDRSGDSKLMICLGGSEYDIHFLAGAANGVVGPPLNPLPGIPQGIIQFPPVTATNGAGPAVTGAGGASFGFGWDIRDGIKGTSYSQSDQAACAGEYWSDRMNIEGAYVSSWANDSYTIAGASGGGGLQTIFCGTDLICKAGYFSAPTSDGDVSFNSGLDAYIMIFQTVGLSTPAVLDTSRASYSFGAVDPALAQGNYWVGETTIGVTPPSLDGCRYISNSQAVRTATANSSSTTFNNIGTVTQLRPNGNTRLAFTNTDGTAPVIQWFAIGLAARSDAINEGKGIYKMIDGRLNDEIYLDYLTGDSALFKIPDPNAYTAFIGDE